MTLSLSRSKASSHILRFEMEKKGMLKRDLIDAIKVLHLIVFLICGCEYGYEYIYDLCIYEYEYGFNFKSENIYEYR